MEDASYNSPERILLVGIKAYRIQGLADNAIVTLVIDSSNRDGLTRIGETIKLGITLKPELSELGISRARKNLVKDVEVTLTRLLINNSTLFKQVIRNMTTNLNEE